jgi:hypothetical protein
MPAHGDMMKAGTSHARRAVLGDSNVFPVSAVLRTLDKGELLDGNDANDGGAAASDGMQYAVRNDERHGGRRGRTRR